MNLSFHSVVPDGKIQHHCQNVLNSLLTWLCHTTLCWVSSFLSPQSPSLAFSSSILSNRWYPQLTQHSFLFFSLHTFHVSTLILIGLNYSPHGNDAHVSIPNQLPALSFNSIKFPVSTHHPLYCLACCPSPGSHQFSMGLLQSLLSSTSSLALLKSILLRLLNPN